MPGSSITSSHYGNSMRSSSHVQGSAAFLGYRPPPGPPSDSPPPHPPPLAANGTEGASSPCESLRQPALTDCRPVVSHQTASPPPSSLPVATVAAANTGGAPRAAMRQTATTIGPDGEDCCGQRARLNTDETVVNGRRYIATSTSRRQPPSPPPFFLYKNRHRPRRRLPRHRRRRRRPSRTHRS